MKTTISRQTPSSKKLINQLSERYISSAYRDDNFRVLEIFRLKLYNDICKRLANVTKTHIKMEEVN